MKKAWIENNVVRDIAQGNPAEIYHPDIAAHYDTDVPDDIENGAKLENSVWVNISVFVRPEVKYINAENVRNGLSLAERTKWDNNTTDTIKTAKIEFATPRLEADATEVLQFLVDSGDISQASMNKVLGL